MLVSALTPWFASVTTTGVVDAAGESCAVVGHVMLEDGPGSTKTISSAGGKIYWRSAAVTFANAGSTLRIGLQDVSATTGLEDGSFDVSADLVGGTDAIAASAWFATAMETGTKTLTHGEIYSIVIELVSRGGADSVALARVTPSSNFAPSANALLPYGTTDAGSLVKSTNCLLAMIEFDDGTVGWIDGLGVPVVSNTRITYAANSATDEYCAVFTPAFTCEVDAIGLDVSDVDSGDDFELILYTDPLGTPSATVTLAIDPDITNSSGGATGIFIAAITPTTLTAGVTYGVAARPTTNNSITFGYVDFIASTTEKWKNSSLFGSTLKAAGRANQTGAFTEVQTYYAPMLFLRISKLDDGAGSGSQFRLVRP